MKNIFKNIIYSFVVVLITATCTITIVKAGSLTPSVNVGTATFYTLGDIYTRLTTNATATEGNHFVNPAGSPAPTFYTLKQIYNAIPTIDASKILTGTTYLGIAGTAQAGYAYGDNSATKVLTTATGAGNYNATNLTVGNVKSGITYGVSSTGTLLPSGGTAAAIDVCNTKTFFGSGQSDWNTQTGALTIDGSKMLSTATYCGTAGTITNGSDVSGSSGSLSFSIPTGYYSAKNCIASDTNLITGNIKSGATIFGVSGNSNVVNTSTGTAGAGDILSGKIAFVGGSQITGNVTAGNNITGSNGQLTMTITDGLYSGSKTATASDSNLSAGNIKSGTAIFGVTGNLASQVAIKTGQATSYASIIAGTAYTTPQNWTNSIAYTLDSKVIDTADSTYWICAVTHTSATSPTTFAQDRSAHPTYWIASSANNYDDGYYQTGTAMSYSDVTVNSIKVAVTDANTGLMWQKCSAGLSGSTCATGSAATKPWLQAIAYCENLELCNDGTFQGSETGEGDCSAHSGALYTNWHLPNVKDLFTTTVEEYNAITNVKSAGSPYINQTYFPATVASSYWSSTTFPITTAYAFGVNYTSGLASYVGKSTNYYIRCVRGQ